MDYPVPIQVPDSHFDVIGDTHGCLDETLALLGRLGYGVEPSADGQVAVEPPAGRRVVFLGDLVNRGPQIAGLLRLVMGMVASGTALCVRGNHDAYLLSWLQGGDVLKQFGPVYAKAVETSLAQLKPEGRVFQREVAAFLDGLPPYLLLDDARLVVAHAGLPAKYQRRASAEGRAFAVFGPRDGDQSGWARSYDGRALVAYGHYARPEIRWSKNSVCLDTGCLYGGHLTALRYPELETVQVAASQVYYDSSRFSERARAQAT